MYLPEHFAETRSGELHALITANPLGALVTSGSDGLDANHVPFELLPDQGPQGTLQAHLALGACACLPRATERRHGVLGLHHASAL